MKRLFAASVLALAVAACGGGDEFGGAAVDQGTCDTERLTLQVAVEAFYAANGVQAQNVSDLAEFVGEAPKYHEILAGEVRATHGGCITIVETFCLPGSDGDSWLHGESADGQVYSISDMPNEGC